MSGMTRSRVKYNKKCPQCSQEFTVPEYRKDTAKYCSRKCTALATRVQTTSDCQECGTEFTHIASRANKAKYCTPKCFHKAMSRKGTVEYTCLHCAKKFLDSPSHKRKYCSIGCVNKAAKSEWNPAFTTVRKNMLKRGLLTACNRCGYDAEPKILGVHHKDRNRKNNDLSNLEVLCPNCHSLEHMKHTPHGFTE
jgi:DNA-directed RNA polymerase subunit RPC12/RpoP